MKKIFISYSWENDEHKRLVGTIGELLESDGLEVTIDQWDLKPGDDLSLYMEKAVSESDYVLIVCSEGYKKKADNRIGGSGYEAKLITTEFSMKQNKKKFIPIYVGGVWEEVSPRFLAGNMYVNLSSLTGSESFERNYTDLLTTICGLERIKKKNIDTKERIAERLGVSKEELQFKNDPYEIKIEGIITNEVTMPKNDGSRGSALYKIPFRLNKSPNSDWKKLFLHYWDRPSSFTSMHRPGIARVEGDKILLDGTMIEEVQKYHRDTLLLAVKEANEKYNQHLKKLEIEKERLLKAERNHNDKISKLAGEIRFD
ncbi:toll/interleukin-1 receptor domain-containing protein [Lysinibacillus fusiformis]|uniref:toll/interleukin-1 receptor domain-containing protein n=1 Tax=Lysinibacillus fusiformis TaxID=28031 RepID=UPI002EB4442F|nr:toll/interleukin-1 receptor domain-containing protein [Lysinibacillus fusiformis]